MITIGIVRNGAATLIKLVHIAKARAMRLARYYLKFERASELPRQDGAFGEAWRRILIQRSIVSGLIRRKRRSIVREIDCAKSHVRRTARRSRCRRFRVSGRSLELRRLDRRPVVGRWHKRKRGLRLEDDHDAITAVSVAALPIHERLFVRGVPLPDHRSVPDYPRKFRRPRHRKKANKQLPFSKHFAAVLQRRADEAGARRGARTHTPLEGDGF